MNEFDRLNWDSNGSIIAEILGCQTTPRERRHHINIPMRQIVESIDSIVLIMRLPPVGFANEEHGI